MTIVACLLVVGALLAITSLVGDSITFDETSHLTAGYSYLKTGDFRLGPDNPPLGKMWCAWPLLLIENQWPSPNSPAWRTGNLWTVGRTWLFNLNDGERLLTWARCMMVVLLLLTYLCIYIITRQLFGDAAALLALTLAVFSPTFLAHGRLVTTDLPMTLGVLLTLLTFARLLACLSWPRWLAAAAALCALSLTKFSWPIVLPALLLMAAVVIFRRKPLPCMFFAPLSPVDKRPHRRQYQQTPRLLTSRRSRAAVIGLLTLVTTATVWAAIWTCFGWRYHPFRGPDRHEARMMAIKPPGQSPPTTMEQTWQMVLTDPQGKEMRGVTANFVRWARRHRMLPESYLYGLAYILRATMRNTSYLLGEISRQDQPWYFPIAFAIKTPIATMLLLLAGVAAVIGRRSGAKPIPILMVGLIGFSVIYCVLAVTSNHNIGHRHLLPIFPTVMVLAGASAAWWRRRVGRVFITAVVVWVIGANLWIHPHYLAYFNEIVGGPARGHLYLADSNIDWGQDIKRLARYARAHPDETIKLAYFGSGDPTKYGFACQKLRSFVWPGGTDAPLTAGTYVISVNQMLGLYDPLVTEKVWNDPKFRRHYQETLDTLAQPLNDNASAEQHKQRKTLQRQILQYRQARLLNQLRHRPRSRVSKSGECRPPDERIGYSLFVHRLSQSQVNELTSPSMP